MFQRGSLVLALFLCFGLSQVLSSHVRFLHESPDAPAVDVFLNGTLLASNLTFGDSTGYQFVDHGFYDIEVKAGEELLLSFSATLAHATEYTAAVIGLVSNNDTEKLRGVVEKDDLTPAQTPTTGSVRLFQASPNVNGLTVQTVLGDVGWTNVTFGTFSSYISGVPVGSYYFQVFDSATSEQITSFMLDVVPGLISTIVTQGVLNGTVPFSVSVQQDVVYEYIRLRFSHAYASGPNVNVELTNETLTQTVATNLPYKKSTGFNYFVLAFNQSIDVHVDKGLFRFPLHNVKAGHDYDLVFEGAVRNVLALSVVETPYTVPYPHDAAFRVTHASFDAGMVNVLFDDMLLFKNVTFKSTTDYVHIPQGSYKVSFVDPETNKTIASATVPSVKGEVSTIFLDGVADSLAVVPVQDFAFTYFDLRVAAASSDLPVVDLNLVIDNYQTFPVAQNVEFQSVTNYHFVGIENGRNYSLFVTNSSSSVLNVSLDYVSGPAVTFTIVGEVNSEDYPLEGLFFPDDNGVPSDSRATKVQFFHTAPSVDAVDVAVNGTVIFEDVEYTDFQSFVLILGSTYHLQVLSSNDSSKVIVDIPALSLDRRTVYTLFLESSGEQAEIVTSVNEVYNDLRVAHAIRDAPPLNVYVYEYRYLVQQFGPLNYKDFSQVVTLPTRNYTVTVKDAKTDVILFEGLLDDLSNLRHTLTLVGTAAQIETALVTDHHEPPSSPFEARFKFVHASTYADTLSVKIAHIEFTLSFTEESEYYTLPTGVHHVQINGTGGVVLFEDSQFLVQGGNIFTFFIEGSDALTLVPLTEGSFDYFALRAVNALPDFDYPLYINIFDGLETFPLTSSLSYPDSTNYTIYRFDETCNYTIQVSSENNGVILYQTLTPASLGDFTFVITGSFLSEIDSFVLADNFEPPDSYRAVRARFFNSISDSSSASIVTSDGKFVFPSTVYGSTSDYVVLESGPHTFYLKVDKQETPVVLDISLMGGHVYTFFAEGLYNDSHGDVAINVFSDVTYNYIDLRVSHASPDTGPVDYHLSTGISRHTVAKDVAFMHASNYTLVPLRHPYYVRVTKAGKPDSTILLSRFEVDPDNRYTSILSGLTQQTNTTEFSLRLIHLHDNKTAPAEPRLGLARFVHAIPGISEVDLYSNDEVRASKLAFGQASELYTVSDRPHLFSVFVSGTTTSPIHSNWVERPGVGEVNSIVATGSAKKVEVFHLNVASYHWLHLAFVHAIVDAGNVDFLIDGEFKYENVTYGSTAAHEPTLLGGETTSPVEKRITILPSGQVSPVFFNATLKLTLDHPFGLVVAGQALDPLHNMLLNLTVPPPTLSAAGVRFVHASPDAPELTVRIGNTTLFKSAAFLKPTQYVDLHKIGTQEIDLVVKDQVVAQASFDFTEGFFTIFAYGLFNTNSSQLGLTVGVYTDLASLPFFAFRAIHAVEELKAVDVLTNSTLHIFNVTNHGASEYHWTPFGTASVSVVPNLDLTPVLLKQDFSVNTRTAHSLLLAGKHGSTEYPIKAAFFGDDLTLPAPGKARVRFINAIPDSDLVELLADGKALFHNISYLQDSEYLEIELKTYTLEIRQHNSTELLLDEAHKFTAEGPAVYTIVAEGFLEGDAVRLVVLLDNSQFAPLPPTPPTPAPPSPHKGGLSGGAIAGIVIGCLALVAVIGFLGFFLYRKRRQGHKYQIIQASDD